MTLNEFVVRDKGGKLSVVVLEKFPRMGYGAWRKLLRKGDVRVNGNKVFSDGYVNIGDVVRVYYDDNDLPKIIYENRLVAVFFKPPKIATVGENSFETLVKKYYPDYICCHRLDTNTDGLVVFAKDEAVFSAMKEAFKFHRIEKHYLAFVTGDVKCGQEAVAYLKKDERLGVVKVTDQKTDGSSKIVTIFSPIRSYETATALDVEIVTGKTHQIRAHLAHLGHPIIGDPKYGENAINRAYNKSFQMLTAYKLIFREQEGLLKELSGVTVELDVAKKLDSFFGIDHR